MSTEFVPAVRDNCNDPSTDGVLLSLGHTSVEVRVVSGDRTAFVTVSLERFMSTLRQSDLDAEVRRRREEDGA